jgi:hypothetical protein
MNHENILAALLSLGMGGKFNIHDLEIEWLVDDHPTDQQIAAEVARLAGNTSILAAIGKIENAITQRRLREAFLGNDGGWLAAKNQEIAALRLTLKK